MAEVISSHSRATQEPNTAPPRRSHLARTQAPPPRQVTHPHGLHPNRNDRNRTVPGSNAWGVAGLTASIIGLFTCGMFSPFGLLLSLIGLAKTPRTNAAVGSLIGAGGSAMFAVFFAFSFFSGFNTAIALEEAASDLDNHYYSAGVYPTEEEAESLLWYHEDAWGRPLRYQRNWDDGFELRSAGLDGTFGTPDDHTLVR